MKINFVNVEHVHALIDLPTKYSIEKVMQLLKGNSSHWINQNRIIQTCFSWGRGYGTFSVSQSSVDKVCKYISNQEEHHRVKTFAEEYQEFVEKYELKYVKED